MHDRHRPHRFGLDGQIIVRALDRLQLPRHIADECLSGGLPPKR
jgi:hypothetical protein